jgi:hypothetical protein
LCSQLTEFDYPFTNQAVVELELLRISLHTQREKKLWCQFKWSGRALKWFKIGSITCCYWDVNLLCKQTLHTLKTFVLLLHRKWVASIRIWTATSSNKQQIAQTYLDSSIACSWQ